MEHNALLEAQLTNAHNEIGSLRTIMRSLSGQISAQRESLNEYLTANIHLRSGNLLLEDDVRNLKNQVNSYHEMIKSIEQDKTNLQMQIDVLTSQKQDDAA
jgi:hypothetical protein